jgi:hypothetical protein
VHEIRLDAPAPPTRVFSTPSRSAFSAWLSSQTPASINAPAAAIHSRSDFAALTHQSLSEAVENNRGVLSDAKYGVEFATRVCQAMEAGAAVIGADHRDYCGMGLSLEAGKFRYGEIYDGYPGEPGRDFAGREDFVAWLADQSDQAMRGPIIEGNEFSFDNQRLTRSTIEHHLATKRS